MFPAEDRAVEDRAVEVFLVEDLVVEHLNPQTSLKNQQRDFSNKEANVTNDLQPVGNGTAASHQSSMDDSMIRPATEGLGGGTVPSQELPDSQTVVKANFDFTLTFEDAKAIIQEHYPNLESDEQVLEFIETKKIQKK